MHARVATMICDHVCGIISQPVSWDQQLECQEHQPQGDNSRCDLGVKIPRARVGFQGPNPHWT
jgi:hypothetical protein